MDAEKVGALMGLAIPLAARTDADRLAFCHRALERLRLWHNERGLLVPAGKAKLADFRVWVREQFDPRQRAAWATLHGLPTCNYFTPPEYDTARAKVVAAKPLTAAESAALAMLTDRQAAKVAGQRAADWDAWIDCEKIPRLGAVGEPPDPNENFTTYTEVDTPGRLTVGASQIDFATLDLDEECYVYKDAGVNHFDGDFLHLSKVRVDAYTTDCQVHPWALSNSLGAINTQKLASQSHLAQKFSAAWYQVLIEQDSGNYYQNYDTAGSEDTTYYTKIQRVEATGTYGTLYGYWYDDAARTNLISSQSIALHTSKKDFRYVYGFASYGSGLGGRSSTGYAGPLDIGEQSVVPLCDHHYRMRRAS